MLDPREAATVLAALLYWQEEMCPHGTDVMRPYFETLSLEKFAPLMSEEIHQLAGRLRAAFLPAD